MDAKKQQGGSTASAQQDQYNPSSQQQGGGSLAQRDERAPARWRGVRNPFELMARMDEDMDRLFRQFWGGGRSLSRGRDGGLPQMWTPQVEVFERDGKLHVHADLPGMKKEEVKVSIDDEQLVIEGERRSSHESGNREQQGYYHSERSYGSFYRTVPLPEGIDSSTAEASFTDGVLKVQFAAPQPRQARSRKLEIR
ncbi:MAG: Hsp20/alpha crystallin family protein [Burkholderiales bacterium]|nr:Hsp20/alpha crystallin family protein [Burkholderiales bacterium]